MKSFLQKFKKAISYTVVGSFLLGSAIAGGTQVGAAGATFNRLQGDREMLVGKTQSQGAYTNPVTATSSDKVTVMMYIHNGGDTAARNSRAKLQITSTGEATKHTIKGTVWADNADAVSSTIVNGHVVGSSDLTINLDKASGIAYVPGSTVWYPDFGSNQNQTGVSLPDGIMTNNGVALGNIDFCWEHVGYLKADFTFTNQVQEAKLQTEKWVALFGGNNQWVKENTANKGDQLRYMVYYNNAGNTDAQNAVVVDRLPDGVSYQAGSTYKRIKDANNNDTDVLIPDNQITFAGQTMTIPLGTVKPGQNNSGYVLMRVKVNEDLSVGTHVLTNNEDLKASNAASVSASAKTTVTVTQTPVANVHILKEVANVTQGSDRWVKENTARPGDRIQYRLSVYNDGNTAANDVSVKDVLPQYVSYVAGSTKVYNASDPNHGQSVTDGVVAGGINLGTIQNGVPTGNRYVVFDAIVSDTIPAGNHDLINSADVFVGGVKKENSTAKTTVTSETGLLITKEVWNAGIGQWVTKLDGVKAGDDVVYRIQVRNTGTTTIANPVIKDVLPQFVTYVANSTQMDNSVQVNDQWITQGTGILIANVTAGNFKTITFKAHVGACPPGGTYTLTNTASVTAPGMGTKTATADIVVTAGPPAVPR